MRTAYEYLAYLIAALTMLQAASAAWAMSGLTKFVFSGGVIDPAAEAAPDFPEVTGFMIHGMNGTMVIPVAALLLVVLAFLAKAPGAVKWAVIVLGLVALQIALGMLGHSLSMATFVHGFNALLLFGAAVVAGRRVRATAPHAVERERSAARV